MKRRAIAQRADGAPSIEGAETLPDWLHVQAERRSSALAFRQKERGLWRSHTWAELEARVKSLVVGLRSRGFAPGDRLLVDAGPSAATFQLSLAAQWLGGAVVVSEPDATGLDATASDATAPEATAPETAAAARFAFAADEAARARLLSARAGGAPFVLGILLDGDDSPEAAGGWLSFDEVAGIVAEAAPPSPVATDATLALIRSGASESDGATLPEKGRPAPQGLTHGDLVRDARELLATGNIDEKDEALAWSDLSLSAQLETVLASWLVAGFRLSFVETPATEDGDRRELGPSLVFGRASTFSALSARTQASLPPSTGRERRWLERALAGNSGVGRFARRLLVHRLREVVGFGRLRRAVALGASTAVTTDFERLFGLPPRQWPPRARGRLGEPRAEASQPRASSPLLGLGAARLGGGSRSDIA
jgi:long-chain acyl-CoA synthetase